MQIHRFHIDDGFRIRHAGKEIDLQYAELNSALLLYLLLESLGELGKAFVCHHMQDVDVLIFDPLTFLIDAQPQPASYLLTAGKGGFLLDKRTDLKYIGVVPALLQR